MWPCARTLQLERNGGRTNAELSQDMLDHVAAPDKDGQKLLIQAAETLGLTARGYHRVLKVARTLADLAGSENIHRLHIAESSVASPCPKGAHNVQKARYFKPATSILVPNHA